MEYTPTKKKTIVFTVRYFNEERTIESYPGEYRNLMVLLNEKFYLESFGECGGMGRCGTCMVEVSGLEERPYAAGTNEATTLGKLGIQGPNRRLACHIAIDEDLNHAVVTIGSDE